MMQSRRLRLRPLAQFLSIVVVGTLPVMMAHADVSSPTHYSMSSSAQLDTNDAPWQAVMIKPGDTLLGLLASRGVDAPTRRRLIGNRQASKTLTRLNPGDVIHLRQAPGGKLVTLRYRVSPRKTLWIRRTNNGLRTMIEHVAVTTHRRVAAGTVRRSLSTSLSKANVPAKIANDLARIYRPKLNLSHDIRSGDRFSVIYRIRTQAGEQVGVGPVVASQITTHGHPMDVFRHETASGHVQYLDANGQSLKLGISRHPVNYTRISSPFSYHRMDPAIHKMQPHYGVDMAAPIGTPIHAAARGTVKYVGPARGYGKLVELTHFDGYTTRYAHLHGYAHGLHDGEHVSRGQTIGTVGNTGWSTGPHLLYEIRKNGVPHNPMTMSLPASRALSGHALSIFKQHTRPLTAILSESHVASGKPTQPVFASRCVVDSANGRAIPYGVPGRSDTHTGCVLAPLLSQNLGSSRDNGLQNNDVN